MSYDLPGSSQGANIPSHGRRLASSVTIHGGQPFNFTAGFRALSFASPLAIAVPMELLLNRLESEFCIGRVFPKG
jgi:hypothetical protein